MEKIDSVWWVDCVTIGIFFECMKYSQIGLMEIGWSTPDKVGMIMDSVGERLDLVVISALGDAGERSSWNSSRKKEKI